MNAPEKIAATYLRLNGFFLMPNFTVFSGAQHADVDLLGVRAPDSHEQVGYLRFPVDEAFIGKLGDTNIWHAVITQVKGNETLSFPPDTHKQYVKPLVGSAKVTCVAFSDDDAGPSDSTLGISVGFVHAVRWIWQRFDFMDNERLRLTKDGSWTWSEPYLSDLLRLRHYGVRP